MYWESTPTTEHDGYVPAWIGGYGVGDNAYGDYVEFTVCRHCGQIRGDWPVDAPEDSKDKYKWGSAW